jgi:ATP-dependent protease ClpP protease subunit
MIRVLALANKKAEILIHEAIGDNWYGDGLTSKRFAKELAALGDVSEIKVRINSPGGSVSDGVAIYNTLKAHGAKINVVVEGLAASIASIIAMAGETISMGEGSLMMIHSPWTFAMGSAEDMRETADVLDKFESALVDIYVSRSGQERVSIEALLKAETWLNGEEAVALGLATAHEGDPAADAAARIAHRAAFNKFATNFRQPADVSPQRIAAALFPSATAESQEIIMTEEEKRAAEAAQKKAIADAAAAAVAADRANEKVRQDAIRAVFTPFADAHRDLLVECLGDASVTAEAASAKLLKAVAEGQPGPLAGRIEVTADVRDKFRAGAQKAILARMGLEKPEAGNEYNGRSLVDIAERCLSLSGISTRGMTKDAIARKVLASHTTSDFPNLLSSTAGKVLRGAYEEATVSWNRWCAVGSVSDFKIHPRIQLGSFSSLATIPEGGEYTYGTINEQYENAQAVTKGKAISFTRQMLVNDDLGGFNRRAQLMGNSAARTVNDDVYASLTSASGLGPTSSDTGTLINATAVTTAGGHANYTSSGTALTVASLGVGKLSMATKKAGNLGTGATLNLRPAVLLTPVGKEDIARTLIASETDPASSNSRVPNIYRNSMEVVSDPYLDGVYANAWYLMVAPSNPAAPMEVVFLDGNQTPFIDDEVDFDSDALKFKVRLDYGVAIGDWRGIYRNLGA